MGLLELPNIRGLVDKARKPPLLYYATGCAWVSERRSRFDIDSDPE